MPLTILVPRDPPSLPSARLAGLLIGVALIAGAAPASAADLDELLTAQDRHAAARTYRRAATALEQARGQAAAARQQLDVFLMEHFEVRAELPPAVQQEPRLPQSEEPLWPDPQLARWKTELGELQSERRQLLETLSEDDALVLDLDQRIDDAERKIAEFGAAMTPTSDDSYSELLAGDPDAEAPAGEPAGAAQQQAADEYRRLFELWQRAELAVDTAIAAHAAAAKQLEVLALAPQQRPPTTDALHRSSGVPVKPGVHAESRPENTAPRTSTPVGDSSNSQVLALGALLLALAIAAFAAVRLARSTADPLFASADEVAAALAIPVVGIIPAAAARDARREQGADRRRGWTLLGEVLMALAVFCATVFVLQAPSGLWHGVTHPIETVGSAIRVIAGG